MKFVEYPAPYDFMFVYWYLMNFAGESPFLHSALDIKTMAMVGLKSTYLEATKRNIPKRWFDVGLIIYRIHTRPWMMQLSRALYSVIL